MKSLELKFRFCIYNTKIDLQLFTPRLKGLGWQLNWALFYRFEL